MIVSGSEIATLNECEMRYVYQFGLGLWPKDDTAAIYQGKCGHTNMQQFFEAIRDEKTKEEALQSMIPVAKDALALKACELASAFCEQWNVESGKVLYCEEQLIAPLEGKVKIGLTPDLVWQFNSGKIVLIDWKFSGRSWSDEASELHYQLPSYKGHLRKHFGINPASLWYVYFNTRNQAENKFKYKKFEIEDREADEVIRDQIKSLDRLIDFRENPVAWSRNEARRVNKIFVCDYCPFKFPCRLGRKGKEKTEQRALEAMYTENTYGYGEDFDE